MSGSKDAAFAASETVMQTMREQIEDGGEGDSAPPSRQSVRGEPASVTPDASDNRRNWQAVLRECQKVDGTRTGLVYREVFLEAVAKSGLTKTLGAQSLSEIADQFMVKDGQVDYLSCFRTYLHGIVSKVCDIFGPDPRPSCSACNRTDRSKKTFPLLISNSCRTRTAPVSSRAGNPTSPEATTARTRGTSDTSRSARRISRTGLTLRFPRSSVTSGTSKVHTCSCPEGRPRARSSGARACRTAVAWAQWLRAA